MGSTSVTATALLGGQLMVVGANNEPAAGGVGDVGHREAKLEDASSLRPSISQPRHGKQQLQQQSSTSISSTSSLQTSNSSLSPTPSLTSIPTNSPTSTNSISLASEFSRYVAAAKPSNQPILSHSIRPNPNPNPNANSSASSTVAKELPGAEVYESNPPVTLGRSDASEEEFCFQDQGVKLLLQPQLLPHQQQEHCSADFPLTEEAEPVCLGSGVEGALVSGSTLTPSDNNEVLQDLCHEVEGDVVTLTDAIEQAAILAVATATVEFQALEPSQAELDAAASMDAQPRLERSNSYSQAETTSGSTFEYQPLDAITGASLSHENLAATAAQTSHEAPQTSLDAADAATDVAATAAASATSTITAPAHAFCDATEASLQISSAHNDAVLGGASSGSLGNIYGNFTKDCDQLIGSRDLQANSQDVSGDVNSQGSKLQQQQQSQTQTNRHQQQQTSSRFFSSKLNTGSLWSLLSVGSGSSSIVGPADMQITENPSLASEANKSIGKMDNSNSLGDKQQAEETSSKSVGFFSRVQFKRSLSQQQQPQLPSNQQVANESTATSGNQQANSMSTERKRFRFNIKYIGSAILHRNFTLPMLEWIAKDIRRQTVKGAQNLSQRQFTIPARDVIFEIQSNQLTAISCKDSHCIFIHPMHCVSKYAQLQHDPTCFSYLIRDTKESPYFCHVFQAKSANKVHDIFSAIREVTTRSQVLDLKQQQRLQSGGGSATGQQMIGLQKSATTDCGVKSRGMLLGPNEYSKSHLFSSPPATLQRQQHQLYDQSVKQTASMTQLTNAASAANTQFENSYQFEVMFVKKVKLQCRRVPPTFVDDALETLKSYEVLKGGDSKASQIKGLGKRIISASVDERQEYDEACQSPPLSTGPTQTSKSSALVSLTDESKFDSQRRGSSSSLSGAKVGGIQDPNSQSIKEERESRSCQQSPTKSSDVGIPQQSAESSTSKEVVISAAQKLVGCNITDGTTATSGASLVAGEQIKKHQSMDCLKSIDWTIKSARQGDAPNYTNDFSPYNTITSNDLNERIAAIPVVSGSVSLDHETRQRLARQVRETIMATAANIKKDVYASGDKLDSSSSSKALDSLSCTATSSVPSIDDDSLLWPPPDDCQPQHRDKQHQIDIESQERSAVAWTSSIAASDHRRSSAIGSSIATASNNFDLFRRASARQVVKNRTMLLLIGKDELCTISIDKHQMLFSKSFNSIVHCLQGSNNKDHFGLICRDSGKINPNAESYAGIIFKCQSDKVVREIMSALKQVIYSSQHNYHGYNSPYNPLNSIAANQQQHYNQQRPVSQKFEPRGSNRSSPPDGQLKSDVADAKAPNNASSSLSLAAKRGFASPIDIEDAARQQNSVRSLTCDSGILTIGSPSTSTTSVLQSANFLTLSNASQHQQNQLQAAKNPIKSMFCDNCPLYWYHRLCCDIESLPGDASKAIILRRIDSSLSEKEQDEIYSRFSEFNIDSVEEHNEIFMSLLRHLCERKQLKHNQSHAHLSAMAKHSALVRQTSSGSASIIQQSLLQPRAAPLSAISGSISAGIGKISATSTTSANQAMGDASNATSAAPEQRSYGHHRSGSSGSFATVIGQSNQASQSIADAGSVAIDNLMRAKNSISVSIENMLKRRASAKDDFCGTSAISRGEALQIVTGNLPTRSGSFKTTSREARAQELGEAANGASDSLAGNLKRSQSTTDYSNNQPTSFTSSKPTVLPSWRDSLSRTINDDLSNPFAGLFRRRSSTFGAKSEDAGDGEASTWATRTSSECLSQNQGNEQTQPSSPTVTNGRSNFPLTSANQNQNQDGLSPSSMLSGAFWKKSIFDKIKQPVLATSGGNPQNVSPQPNTNRESSGSSPGNSDSSESNSHGLNTLKVADAKTTAKRTSEELRLLWRKAIHEQITLLKMDKQNQKLHESAPKVTESNIQRIKLNYKDVVYSRDAIGMWDKLLKQDPTTKVDFVEVARHVRLGIPKQRRGEAWMFLMNQYQLRHGTSFQPADSEYKGDANQTYRSLLSQLSTQQHEIFVDIGRTFPSHPYYSQYLSIGQLSLFNLLKAYSLLDQEVGYCQGLSFVAGILLLHVDSEDEAFELMRHLLFNFGLRKQYLPSMNALHLQLYQMTRLLRDYELELFNLFDRHDISPSLYAAPWFLTLFASQFPLGFVARLLDLIFLIGIEAIFRVSLNLLAYFRSSLLSCSSLESTMEFMKNDLSKIGDKNLAKIFDKSLSLDLRNKLIEYEIEYTFYCAEDRARSGGNGLRAHQSPSLMRSTANRTPADKRENPKEVGSNDGCKKDDEHHDGVDEAELNKKADADHNESTSVVADATATVIIQHLLANNHLKSLRSNYTY